MLAKRGVSVMYEKKKMKLKENGDSFILYIFVLEFTTNDWCIIFSSLTINMPNCITIGERSKYSIILKVNYTYNCINFYPCIHLFHVELLKFSAEISCYTCLFCGFFSFIWERHKNHSKIPLLMCFKWNHSARK